MMCRFAANPADAQRAIAAKDAEIARLREGLRDYMFAEEIDDPSERLIELAACRHQARKLLENTNG